MLDDDPQFEEDASEEELDAIEDDELDEEDDPFAPETEEEDMI